MAKGLRQKYSWRSLQLISLFRGKIDLVDGIQVVRSSLLSEQLMTGN
jgi:hypothetical protein